MKVKRFKKSVGLFVALTAAVPQIAAADGLKPLSRDDKQRLIVTTDLGGTDPDDIQSMIHMLVCADRMDIEGLVSSQVWMDDPDKTPEIRKVVERYAEVLPNLKRHSAGFPDADYLLSVTVRGQEHSNMSGVGDGKDSPGSELIIAAVDKKDDRRPVWIAAWGGMNTVAQALWNVSHTRSAQALDRFVRKIRVYDVLGQDDAGAWIAKTFPQLIYIRNKEVYGWGPSDQWTKENVQSRQPLGAHYPDRRWATEGDSPSFFYVYANGLNVPERVDYGGWGGRFDTVRQTNIRGMSFIERSGKDETLYDDYYMYGSAKEGNGAINMWRQHIWNDFAARMMWTATDDYSAANHHPVAMVDGDSSLKCMYKKAKAGGCVSFDASESADPDGDELEYRWFVYKEPGTYNGEVDIEGGQTPRCTVLIPRDASGKSIHLVLEVTDKGCPALTAYRRIVIGVK